jgi:hypothetical protein
MSNEKPSIVVAPKIKVDTLPETPSDSAPEIGRWYWVHEPVVEDSEEEPNDLEPKKDRWLGCVIHVGSNYAELQGVGQYSNSERVLLDDFEVRCTFVPDADTIIQTNVANYQQRVHSLMGQVREITARLAITPGMALPQGGSEMSALALRSDQPMEDYKTALVEAKEKTLPELFKAIRAANEGLGRWMSATLIPLEAQAAALEPAIGAIKNRLFSVELYAGLVEEVEQVREGEPAALTEKIHLMQRRAYMDEECLAQYEVGGMEFKDLPAFDRWLARPANLNRLMPFPRCILAFRVRRHEKNREMINLRDFLRILDGIEADKSTYLYIRNGEQLFRLGTAIEFDEKLFPNMDHQRLTGKLWARMFGDTVEHLISDNEYQALLEQDAKNKKEERYYRSSTRDYQEFSPDNVYHDDIAKYVQEEITKHNRLVLVLQGLLDRSPVLHPHPQWSLWTAGGFTQALTLIYDDARALVAGPKPDFKQYREKLNRSLKTGSVTVGQQRAWLKAEAAKESDRRDRDYRHQSDYRPTEFQPRGNPGPGSLAYVKNFRKTAKTCTYEWGRRRSAQSWKDDAPLELRCTFTTPAQKVLNVSAYKPGDFRLFFNDPRTRSEYLKWAPMLLEAEEFHAGNRPLKPPKAIPPRKKTEDGSWLYSQRKARKALIGKAVRLTREVETTTNIRYKIGSLWRVYNDRGKFLLVGITPEGITEEEPRRRVRGVESYSFEVDYKVPAMPKPQTDQKPEPKAEPDEDEDEDSDE